jgi:hypothetical protein
MVGVLQQNFGCFLLHRPGTEGSMVVDRLYMQQPSVYAQLRQACAAHLHLLVQAVVQYEGVRHLHAVRLHWMAGSIVVGADVGIIEVGHLQTTMPPMWHDCADKHCGPAEHAAMVNVYRYSTVQQQRAPSSATIGRSNKACRARRGRKAPPSFCRRSLWANPAADGW